MLKEKIKIYSYMTLMIKFLSMYLDPRASGLFIWTQILNHLKVSNRFLKVHLKNKFIEDKVTFDTIN